MSRYWTRVKLQFVFILFLASLSSEVSWPWFPFPLYSFFLSLFSRYVLYQQSPVHSLCCSILSFSLTLSRSLLMQSPISVFLASFPLQFLDIWSLFQFFIYHSFHMTGALKAIRHHFFLKHSFTPTSTLSSSILLLSSLLTTTILPVRLFSQTWTISCCFSVSAIVYNALMPG